MILNFSNRHLLTLSEILYYCITVVVANNHSEETKPEPKSEEIYVVSGGVIDPPWNPPQTCRLILHTFLRQ